jgi:Na+/phosphate symporter
MHILHFQDLCDILATLIRLNTIYLLQILHFMVLDFLLLFQDNTRLIWHEMLYFYKYKRAWLQGIIVTLLFNLICRDCHICLIFIVLFPLSDDFTIFQLGNSPISFYGSFSHLFNFCIIFLFTFFSLLFYKE